MSHPLSKLTKKDLSTSVVLVIGVVVFNGVEVISRPNLASWWELHSLRWNPVPHKTCWFGK